MCIIKEKNLNICLSHFTDHKRDTRGVQVKLYEIAGERVPYLSALEV